MKTLFSALVAVLAVGAVACAPSEQFVGLWTGSGTATFALQTPNGPQSVVYPLSNDSVTIVDGAATDVVFNWQGCNVPGSVKEELTTFTPGYVCTLTRPEGTFVYTFNAGNAAVTQTSINMTASGPVSITQRGATYPGTFTLQEQLTKVGKN